MNPADSRDPFRHLLMAELIGHADQQAQLKLLLEKSSVPHALIFSGPAGIGKRLLARAFGASILAGQNCTAEFLAETVRLVRAGTHPDYHPVTREEDKRDLSVDAVRELTSKLQLKPYYGKATITVIDNAHQMNAAAANALLKTLEEPNPHSYLFLITDSPHRLLETVVSRCQQMYFGVLDPEQCLQLISRLISELEGLAVTAHDLHELARTSLDPLALEPFVDSRTLKLIPGKALNAHLDTLAAQAHALQETLETLLAPGASLTTALSVAAELSSDKEALPAVWNSMRRFLYRRLKSAEASGRRRWAELILACIESEKLCRERNLSPQLQLSSVLARVVGGSH